MIIIKKIVPFKKDIIFDTNIYEVTSISLDHEFNLDNNIISGKFIISGEYKEENDTESINYKKELPFAVDFDSTYKMDDAVLDIDDFYYEIDKNILKVSIDVLVNNIEKIEIEDKRCVEEEDTPPKLEEPKQSDGKYKSYTVYIVREGDTIEGVIKRYGVSRDEILEYNDISNIKVGDKIIIPS